MRKACFAIIAVLAAGFACAAGAHAEIVKGTAPSCRKGEACPTWWPKLPEVPGWHSDDAVNAKYNANTLAPKGKSFEHAKYVIYASANYKGKHPNAHSVDEFAEEDMAAFRKKNPNIQIAEVDPLVTADGQKLRSFAFSHEKNGDWERVSYGEEGDYYLVFVLTAHSEKGYAEALPAYESLVQAYTQ